MALPSRRVHGRFPCSLSVLIRPTGGRELAGEVLNISVGGALLRVPGTLPSPQLALEIASGKDKVAVAARVVRSAGADPKDPKALLYGVTFQHDERSERKVRILIDRVRGAHWDLKTGGREGALKRDYWNL